MTRRFGWPDAIVLLAATVAVLATARLGFWQLDRARQKTELQRSVDERGRVPPLAPAELAREADGVAAQLHRRVELHGRWIVGSTRFLENRQMNGRPGFFVVSALALADGDAVAVQRGWLPRDPQERTRVAAPPLAPGQVVVSGRVAPPPARLFEFDPAASGPIRQNLPLPAYAGEIGVRLRPFSVLQQSADAPGDPLRRDWTAPAVDVSKHHGYAFQWFSLSALVTGLYVWFQLIRPRRRRAA